MIAWWNLEDDKTGQCDYVMKIRRCGDKMWFQNMKTWRWKWRCKDLKKRSEIWRCADVMQMRGYRIWRSEVWGSEMRRCAHATQMRWYKIWQPITNYTWSKSKSLIKACSSDNESELRWTTLAGLNQESQSKIHLLNPTTMASHRTYPSHRSPQGSK